MLGVLDNILFAAETSYSDLTNPRLWLVDALSSSATSKTGETVNPSTALSVSTYFACIRAISEDVASLPLIVYRRRTNGERERATDHPLYRILHDSPNAVQTSMSLRETATQHSMGYGNGLVRILRNSREVVGLKLIHASRLTQIRVDTQPDGTDELTYVFRNEKDALVQLPADEVLHVHGLGDDGYQGYSVAKIGCESIGMGLASQSFAAAYFLNGATPTGVLETPEVLDESAVNTLRTQWSDRYSGLSNSHKPLILEKDMKWHSLGINPEDAQLLESRQFAVEDICRWFRMPPHKVQHLLRSTFSNIEHQSIEYVVDTLRPWLRRWEQEIDKKLLGGGGEYYCEHLVEDLLAADISARSANYRELFHIGVLSQNDIRKRENLNPIENGDTYYVPANLLPSERASENDREPDEDAQPDGGMPQPGTGRREASEFTARACIPVVDAAIGRVLRKEIKALSRLHSKYSTDRQAFNREVDAFYADVSVEAEENLAPIVCMVAELSGVERKSVTTDLVRWHVENSRLRVAQHFMNLPKELESWESRAAATRAKLLEMIDG